MWLPETAVNIETLEVLAEHGINFTILSPHQAQKFAKQVSADGLMSPKDNWILLCLIYAICLQAKAIVLFFYNGKVANDVAYGGLLHSGKDFADKLIGSFNNNNNRHSACTYRD